VKTLNPPSASPIGLGAEITNHRGSSTVPCFQQCEIECVGIRGHMGAY
jgi:hypothetical protein